jgi:hypothetical protein
MNSNERIQQIHADPSASTWLKSALESALSRDPCDAANDAEALAAVLADRCNEALNIAVTHKTYGSHLRQHTATLSAFLGAIEQAGGRAALPENLRDCARNAVAGINVISAELIDHRRVTDAES